MYCMYMYIIGMQDGRMGAEGCFDRMRWMGLRGRYVCIVCTCMCMCMIYKKREGRRERERESEGEGLMMHRT